MSRINKILALSVFAGYYGAATSVELIDKPYEHKQVLQTMPKASQTPTHDGKSKALTSEQSSLREQVSVVANAVPAPAAIPGQQWILKATDVNYAGAIQRWAEQAGYQVRWDANKHFYIEAENTFVGSFEDVVTSVLGNPAVAYSSYPLEVCFYPNTPPLARITRRGEQIKECN